jgi:CCR4-NOT transcription complex subunit 6
MYSQGHQQGQHGRMQVMYNYQQQNPRQHQQHTHHHPSLQQENSGQSANGTIFSHDSSYPSGVLSNSTPNFTPSSLQNTTATRGGQAQQISEHWAEQLKLYNESQRAHTTMTEQHAPHYYARTKAGENRVLDSTSQDGEAEDRRRPSDIDGGTKRQDWRSMDMSGLGLRILAAPLFTSYAFLNELYLASNKLSQLPAAIGQLRQLRHLDISSNHLTDLPPELGMCVYLKNLLIFDNNIRSLPGELGSLYQLEMLGIEGNPLDGSMKQEIVEGGTKSLIHHLREEAPVPLPPPARSMVYLQDGPPLTNPDRFKVFSYNILCDNYVNIQQYPYTPLAALAWDYRKELILQEIQGEDPDFVCLQEVNTNSFEEFFSMKLAYADYKGIFWPKTRSKTMSEKDAKVADGSATFYKANKYILLDKQVVDFANIAIHRPDMKNQHDIYNRVMPRDDIAVVTFFENRLTGARIVIVNTHIFWNPAYPDVKLIQIAILMEYLSKLLNNKYVSWPASKDKKRYTIADEDAEPEIPADSMEYTSSAQLPLVLCTDLNSTPDSSVYELLSTGRVARDHPELGNYQYGHFTRDGIQHPFSLRSAYSLLNDTPDEVTFTNYTPGFIGMIDHIWYSTNALEVTALLGRVDPEYMKRVPGFPNYHFPSDHLSLLAEFQVKGRKEKKNLPEPDFGPQRSDRRG